MPTFTIGYAARSRKLCASFNQRILFYTNTDDAQRTRIDERVNQLEAHLWDAVRGQAAAQPTPVTALVLAGMNDVINSHGYTQAAYWNRIPTAAWYLLAAIALCCNVLFGYRMQTTGKLALVLPLVVSISLLLIADIDAPRHGLIHVSPQNLESLARSLGH